MAKRTCNDSQNSTQKTNDRAIQTTLNTGDAPERSAGTAPYDIRFDTSMWKLIPIALIKQEPHAKDTGDETNRTSNIAADITTQS
jgi:hypothetical protein